MQENYALCHLQVWLQGPWWSRKKQWTTLFAPSLNRSFWVKLSPGTLSWMREWPTSFCSALLSFKLFQQWSETPCAPMTSMKVQYEQNSIKHLFVIPSCHPLTNPVFRFCRSGPTGWSSVLLLPRRETGVSEESLWGRSEEYWNGVHCFRCYVPCLWSQRYYFSNNANTVWRQNLLNAAKYIFYLWFWHTALF